MKLVDNPDLMRIKAGVIFGMREYMKIAHPDYTEKDIQFCNKVLDDHLVKVSVAKNAQAALDVVQATVLQLNELNDKVANELIETDQREGICEFIILAGHLMGFNEKDEDVTEEWREW